METQNCVENKRNESEDRSERSDATASQEFSRANIVARESDIRLVDSDEETGLDLFCYNRCDNNESDFIKQCRGLVFHGDSLVLKAFSYADEYSHTDVNIVKNLLTDFPKWSFYSSYEGALLRLFYFSGKWFLSTHRKLNAFRSKWASRESFGTLFKRALEQELAINQKFAERLGEGENILERYQNTLDKTKQYMFLLRNSYENRIVCDPAKETDTQILHVGTFVNGELSTDEDIGISYPRKYTFANVDDLLNYIGNDIDPKSLQGIICFGPNNKQFKILNGDYMEMFRTRGNEPSLKYRYLQVRMNKKMTEMLYRLYPEMKSAFDDYENTIYDIARNIYRAYVQRFIKKRYVTVPKDEYQVINECHAWHLSDRENNRVTLDRVIQFLNKRSPTNINHMIRRLKIEQSKKETTVPRTVQGSRNNSAVNSPAVIAGFGPEPTVLKHLPPPRLN